MRYLIIPDTAKSRSANPNSILTLSGKKTKGENGYSNGKITEIKIFSPAVFGINKIHNDEYHRQMKPKADDQLKKIVHINKFNIG